MSRIRLTWADSIKGWLMIFVIVGHAIQLVLADGFTTNHVWNYIYSFHMPAFMAISGWLSFRKFEKNLVLFALVKRRALQLLVPYFAWSTIQFAQSGNYSIQNISKMIFFPDSYFWFLWVLFWICILFNYAQFISTKCKINEIIIIGAFCVLLMSFMVGIEIRMFGFQFLAYYFIFYSLGYFIHKYENSTFLTGLGSPFSMFMLAILWAFLAWGWTMHELPTWVPPIPYVPSVLLQYAYRGFTALVAIIVLIGTAPKFLSGTTPINSFISGVGVISLGMYTGHLVFLSHIINWLQRCCSEMPIWIVIVISSILAFVLAYLLIRLLENNKLTARIFLGKI